MGELHLKYLSRGMKSNGDGEQSAWRTDLPQMSRGFCSWNFAHESTMIYRPSAPKETGLGESNA
jgi:hypothetical protein